MEIIEHTGSPAKLPSGDWGVKCDLDIEVGAKIQVITRAGKTWNAEVTEIIRPGLAATKRLQKRRGPSAKEAGIIWHSAPARSCRDCGTPMTSNFCHRCQ